MSNYQLGRYYQLRNIVMPYFWGTSEVRPTDKERSEYVRLFNLYVWNVKGPNQPERRCNGYVD